MGENVVSKNQVVYGWMRSKLVNIVPRFLCSIGLLHTSTSSETQADLQEHGNIGGSSPAYTPGPNSIGACWG